MNLWLVTRGQGLILIERWFAHLWGLNDWFWRLFLLFAFLEILIVKIFYSWRFFHGGFFFWNFFFEIVPLWRLFNYSSLRLKNCFGLLLLRLKIFVLVIWLRAQGRISKWMLTQGWSLEFWLTQGQIWSLKWFFDFGYLFGLAFRAIELILLFLNVSLKF